MVGKKGRHLTAATALDHLAGYTVGHDVSARDWQLEKDGRQWLAGKTFDTFAPLGPTWSRPTRFPTRTTSRCGCVSTAKPCRTATPAT